MSKTKHLPHNLCTPFMFWMFNGGYISEIKKNCVVLHKSKNVAKIHCDGKTAESYLMNDHCSDRYAMFLKQYLNNGKSFIDALNAQATQQYEIASLNPKFNYLQVA
ncbi:hypothetical protein QR665_12720 [Acinetobacter gerneri]|uniref:hypothetical protein n=1 Tax=Acinetobacter gerneri TaxID=202952 RepID=UPI002935EE77|nr:hypothetical protein [Acinetobacter gerneri]MDV2440327.1 hypothetical protein [Acinetobacter gerneri]